MRKIIPILCLGSIALAEPYSIGARVGGGSWGGGGEISYQHTLSTTNRLEGDLGVYGDYFTGTAIYQWQWDIESGWSWFAGPGASIGLGAGIGFGVGGQVGIEFDFNTINAPLQMSLDARPMIGTTSGFGAGLSLRYTF